MPNSNSAATQPQRSLPTRPSLEHLKNEAKQRLKLERSRQPNARLCDAQLAIAREYGFPSWRALRAYLEAILLPSYDWRGKPDSLTVAADRKDLIRVRELLARTEPSQHDLDLSLARALYGEEAADKELRFAIADLLIEAGANPNGQYGGNYGPIVFAICEGQDADALEYLIDHGTDVSFAPVQTKYGWMTPVLYIQWTYVRGRNESRHRALDLLIEHGAVHSDDVFLAIHRGDAGRLAAFLNEDRGLVHKRFPELSGKGNLSLEGTTLLHAAIEFGEWDCVKLLLDRGADLNAKADSAMRQTPIFHAIQSWRGANFQLLRRLLEQEFDRIDWTACARIDGQEVTPAERARGNARELQLLIRAGVPAPAPAPKPSIDAEVLKSFREALDKGQVDKVHALLHDCPDLVNSSPWSPQWECGPVEGLAGRCVWHRPRMHELAEMLVDHGAQTDFQTLARCGLVREVKRQLDDEPDLLNQIDSKGRTALYRATCVYGGFPDGEAVADELMRRGASVDIWTASTLGMIERVRELLRQDPTFADAADPDGMRPLHWACRPRRDSTVEIVRLLCEAGANVEAVNPTEQGMRPLHHCGEWMSQKEIPSILLEFGAEINAPAANGWTPLDYAIDRGRHATIGFLSERGAKRSAQHDDEPRQFLAAVSRGDLEKVKEMAAARPALINEAGPHPMWGGRPQALHVAIERGDRAIFAWLLENGADLDGVAATYDGWTPLLVALEKGRSQMATELTQRGAKIRLPEALMQEDDVTIERMLSSEPALAVAEMPGLASPLRFARTVKAAARLLELGAPLNRKDRYETAPIESVANAGAKFEAVVRFLIERGADAPAWIYASLGDLPRLQALAAHREKEIASDVRTAGAAIEAGQLDILEWMLKQGLSANARSERGSRGTLLHEAAWNGKLEIAKVLLAHGADKNATDAEYGTTPAVWAQTAYERLGRKECLTVAAVL